MNLLQLVLKQMRQRALSTWLTLLSVILGSALAVGVLILKRESGQLFVQTDFGYDILVGAKGSPMQLVLNTVYHVDTSPGNIPYVLYEAARNNRAMVKHAVPYVVGDTYLGFRVVGTLPSLFGFDETTGKPLAGYDDTGRRKSGVLPAPADDSQRDPSKQYAASTFEYRFGKKFTLSRGRMFHPQKFEAVLGSEVAQRSNLKLGDKFKVQHDAPAGAKNVDEHDEKWTVVGVLDPTGTAEDRVVYIPLISFYAIPQHEKVLEGLGEFRDKMGLSQPAPKKDDHDHDHPTTPETPHANAGLPTTTAPAKKDDHDDHDHDHKPATKPATTTAAPHVHAGLPTTTKPAHDAHDDHDDHEGHAHADAYLLRPDGTIDLKLSKDRWMLSAILVRTRAPTYAMAMQYAYKQGDSAMAVNPASTMREFFDTFLKPGTQILWVLSLVVLVTAAVSILVSIYNAVSARSREIAIMRALGATRARILSLICVEAGLVGLIGGLAGLLIGHGLGAAISIYFSRKMGTGINWVATGLEEWIYLAGVVVLAVLAGLVPGLKAYRTPVATNLVAS